MMKTKAQITGLWKYLGQSTGTGTQLKVADAIKSLSMGFPLIWSYVPYHNLEADRDVKSPGLTALNRLVLEKCLFFCDHNCLISE